MKGNENGCMPRVTGEEKEKFFKKVKKGDKLEFLSMEEIFFMGISHTHYASSVNGSCELHVGRFAVESTHMRVLKCIAGGIFPVVGYGRWGRPTVSTNEKDGEYDSAFCLIKAIHKKNSKIVMNPFFVEHIGEQPDIGLAGKLKDAVLPVTNSCLWKDRISCEIPRGKTIVDVVTGKVLVEDFKTKWYYTRYIVFNDKAPSNLKGFYGVIETDDPSVYFTGVLWGADLGQEFWDPSIADSLNEEDFNNLPDSSKLKELDAEAMNEIRKNNSIKRVKVSIKSLVHRSKKDFGSAGETIDELISILKGLKDNSGGGEL